MERISAEIDATAREVVDAAYQVHRELGPGLLESVYEACFRQELTSRGIEHRAQLTLPVRYKGIEMDAGLRIDALVEGRVLVELKSVERLMPVHAAQVLTYLKLAKLRLGLLINFNVPLIRDGIRRLAL
jgi:GxxExxY protein